MQGRRLRLAQAEARWRAAFELAPVAMLEHDFSGTVLAANPAMAELAGRPLAGLVGGSWFSLVHPDDRPEVRTRVEARAAGQQGPGMGLEVRVLRPDGQVRYVKAKGALLDRRAGLSDRVLLHLTDLSNEHAHKIALEEAADRLRYQALHDNLTGLANRALLREHLARASDRGNSAPALFFLDLDRFKTVNDTFGHAVGDELLMAVAARLRTVVRPTDLIARLGGDEFVILAYDVPDEATAVAIAERTCEVVRKPVLLQGCEISVGCSIGITFPHDGAPEALLRQADAALYRAKARGDRGWEFFSPSATDAPAYQERQHELN